MAQSTAQRFRSRQSVDSAVLLDFVPAISSNVDRTLQDFVDVVDDQIATHRRLLVGDRINVFSDSLSELNVSLRILSDSVDVQDIIDVVKSTRKTLSEFVDPRDDGFITDRDLLRQRVLMDELSVADFSSISVTRANFVINSRLIVEFIVVDDAFTITRSGVVIKALAESLDVTDVRFVSAEKSQPTDSAQVFDSTAPTRYVSRVLRDELSLIDDVIVGRSAIINTKVLSDSILMDTDRLVRTTGTFLGVSAEIKHGIENQ